MKIYRKILNKDKPVLPYLPNFLLSKYRATYKYFVYGDIYGANKHNHRRSAIELQFHQHHYKTESGLFWCIVVCNPINHVAEKTLGFPTPQKYYSLKVETVHVKINRKIYIFPWEAISCLYYTRHYFFYHWLYGFFFIDIVYSACWWSQFSLLGFTL